MTAMTSKGNFASLVNQIKSVDAYPKTMNEFRVRTAQGGAVSAIAMLCVTFLLWSELSYYFQLETVDVMSVDGKRHSQVQINIDIDFPRMPCAFINIEALDLSGNAQHHIEQHHFRQTRLDISGAKMGLSEPYELGNALKDENELLDKVKGLKDGSKTTDCGSCYGAGAPGECCNDCEAVRIAYKAKGWTLPKLHSIEQCATKEIKKILELRQKEGCNLAGNITVAKVAGKFYFAPAMLFKHGHELVDDLTAFTFDNFNNSHRINRLSFGIEYPDMRNPLDGYEKQLPLETSGIYQYYLKVVPTEYVFLSGNTLNTNQISVTEHFLKIAPSSGRGLPGVYFMYDFSPIMCRKELRQRSFFQFLTSVCAIAGGIFTVMGVIDSGIYAIMSKATRNLLDE